MTTQADRTEPLTVAVRAHTERIEDRKPRRNTERRGRGDWRKLLAHVLIFDTETRIDHYQSLMFGCWRFCEVSWDSDRYARLSCLEEGLFYADELPETDPQGFELIHRYAALHDPQTDPDIDSLRTPPAPLLRLFSRREFAMHLRNAAWRSGVRAAVVGFNLPFDLSRIAVGWGDAKDERFAGGFSLVLHDYPDPAGLRLPADKYKSRVKVKAINSKASLIAFGAPDEVDPIELVPDSDAEAQPQTGLPFRGHFLDLRTLAFSHTNESHSLESACEELGVPYTKRDVSHGKITDELISYCREDVAATGELCAALLSEHRLHPIKFQPTKAYSPASIGKDYLRTMGVSPALERSRRFPREVLGYAMSAYYGGRTECHIRRQSIPIIYTDFLSMYPTVCALLELWPLMTSGVRAVETDPAEIERWLSGLDGDKLFDPARWPELRALVQIKADGDILPVRARYGATQSYNIGVNRYTSPSPQWYALPDIAASTILTKRPPRILRAIRIERPARRAPALTPVRLRGEVEIDPRREDFFRRVIEQRKLLDERRDLSPVERKRLGRFLKVLANATAYGIYAEMNRQEQPGERRALVDVYGLESYQAEVAAPEEPGDFYFPPIACLITSAAKLMLALLEHQITNLGGNLRLLRHRQHGDRRHF